MRRIVLGYRFLLMEQPRLLLYNTDIFNPEDIKDRSGLSPSAKVKNMSPMDPTASLEHPRYKFPWPWRTATCYPQYATILF